jgi:phage terminase large subunit-like protein
LACGTNLKFHAYSQSQANYESAAYDGFLYDEQPPEVIFNAIDERTRTLKGKHYFTLTPHKVEGRPDTGGGGWLQKFLTGEEKKGHKISCYNTPLADVPDWIYPETEKIKAVEKWITEPTKLRNMKTLREGRSRVYGEWHKTSGLVIDEWERRLHVIDDFEIPMNWTRYRAVDHGITNPTACLWIAVSPPIEEAKMAGIDKFSVFGSECIVYREFYSQGKLINENVHDIVKASGNVRKQHASRQDIRSGGSMPVFEEVQKGEWYAKTVLDSRSFALSDPGSGKTYGHIYRSCGLPCAPASGKLSQHWVPILKELFAPDYNLTHSYNGNIKGRPHLMVFRSCVNLIRELEGWIWEEYRSGGDTKNAKETPRKKDDHGCTALGYAAQVPLRWRGDLYRPPIEDGNNEGYVVTEQQDEGYREI